MPFVTAEELLEASKAGRYRRYNAPNIDTIEDAQKVLDAKLQEALNNHQGNKQDRPWLLVDLGKSLDPDQPWIGFEFETGFDSRDDYRKFINFLWGQSHTAIDKEGTGQYPVEVAFAPQNYSDVEAGNCTLLQTVEFIRDQGLKPALNPTTFSCTDVGIHGGLSTPKYRKYRRQQDNVCPRLSDILKKLNKAHKIELFGRHELHWGYAHPRNGYIELKLFKAIPEVERVIGYIQVTMRMAALVDYLIDNPQVEQIKNTHAFLSGREETILS